MHSYIHELQLKTIRHILQYKCKLRVSPVTETQSTRLELSKIYMWMYQITQSKEKNTN